MIFKVLPIQTIPWFYDWTVGVYFGWWLMGWCWAMSSPTIPNGKASFSQAAGWKRSMNFNLRPLNCVCGLCFLLGIVEQFGFEGTLKIINFQPLAMGRDTRIPLEFDVTAGPHPKGWSWGRNQECQAVSLISDRPAPSPLPFPCIFPSCTP